MRDLKSNMEKLMYVGMKHDINLIIDLKINCFLI